jgi:hypothetical protein
MKLDSGDKKLLFWAAILTGFLGLILWYSVAQYAECREMGFSAFYCIKHAM